MALQIIYTDDKDNEYSQAYARIEEINTHFQDRRAHMVVAIYKNQTAMQKDKQPVGFAVHDLTQDTTPKYNDVFGQALYDASQTDPRKLGYIYMKTLPMYSAGTDV